MGIFRPDHIPAPRRRIRWGQASEGGLQVLIESLRLSIGLWMVPRGEADRSPNKPAEGSPKQSRELGPTIRDHIKGKTEDPEDMLTHSLSSLKSRGEFGQGDKPTRLGKAVDNNQNNSVSLGEGKTCNKVHGYVGPGSLGNGERV